MIYLLPREVVRIRLRFVTHKTLNEKQYVMIKPLLLFVSHVLWSDTLFGL